MKKRDSDQEAAVLCPETQPLTLQNLSCFWPGEATTSNCVPNCLNQQSPKAASARSTWTEERFPWEGAQDNTL